MTARLVLFVGAALQPGEPLAAMLSRDGMRSLWLGGVDEALAAARLMVYDAVVIDAAAVEGPASGQLTQMRAAWCCPILLVAQQADEIDEIVALELGADAYLIHPLAPRRLRAHLRALMRLRQAGRPADTGSAEAVSVARFDGWLLDRTSGVFNGDGQRVELSRVQSRLLACLMDAEGQPVPRADLLAALPRGPGLAARSVDVYVSRLRQRLDGEGVQRLGVQLVRGYGYALRRAQAARGSGNGNVQQHAA
jgi:two-component system, OmpR family, response regulator